MLAAVRRTTMSKGSRFVEVLGPSDATDDADSDAEPDTDSDADRGNDRSVSWERLADAIAALDRPPARADETTTADDADTDEASDRRDAASADRVAEALRAKVRSLAADRRASSADSDAAADEPTKAAVKEGVREALGEHQIEKDADESTTDDGESTADDDEDGGSRFPWRTAALAGAVGVGAVAYLSRRDQRASRYEHHPERFENGDEAPSESSGDFETDDDADDSEGVDEVDTIDDDAPDAADGESAA
jgi:hypothetical protein